MPDATRDQPPRLCAVVDAHGTGQFLPAALRRYGIQCAHVQSAHPDTHLSVNNSKHGIAVEVRHTGDLAATVAALRELGADYVIAGGESGVQLADALAAQLGVPGNGMRNPLARRNKYEMATAVRRAGLAAADVMRSASAGELVDWAAARGEWPVVVKPAESVGADNVFFCFSAEDVRRASDKVLASIDRYGRKNQSALAQQFLTGDEHYINTVSRDGRHHVSEIWQYHKRRLGNRLIYDYEHPLPASDPAAVAIARYTAGVLDALEIRNGAGHAEVMLTPAGPVLVECGARMCGSLLPEVVSRCFGTNHVELTALSIARPGGFARLAGSPYHLATHVRYVSLINPQPGIAPADAALAPIRSLPSFAAMALTHPAGRPLPQTVDMLSSPGYVYLVSDDPDQVESDYLRLRELEETGLYAPAGVAA